MRHQAIAPSAIDLFEHYQSTLLSLVSIELRGESSRPFRDRRIASDAKIASSTPSSDSENHARSRYIRRIVSHDFGFLPRRPGQKNGSISPTNFGHGIVACIVPKNVSRRDARRRFADSTSVKLICSLGMSDSPRRSTHTPGKTPLKTTEEISDSLDEFTQLRNASRRGTRQRNSKGHGRSACTP